VKSKGSLSSADAASEEGEDEDEDDFTALSFFFWRRGVTEKARCFSEKYLGS
jgi:hypothetical protein